MKKIQINRTKANAKGGRGFYLALALSLLAIGASAWFGITAAMQKLKSEPPTVSAPHFEPDGDTLELPADTPITIPETSEPEEKPESKTEEPAAADVEPEKSTAFAMPVSGGILNAYSGDKMVKSKTLGDWVMHTGVDLNAAVTTPVKSVGAGTVTAVQTDDLWGCTVTVTHANGIESYYANLGEDIRVTVGQTVKLGDVLGTVGETADIERAEETHLHLGMKKNGEWIDPIEFIKNKK